MNFLLMDATEAASRQVGMVGGLMQFMPFIMIFAVMYFLMIRPQKKKQQEHQQMLENLQIHDKVVTSGGIIGKIISIKKEKNIVTIRVDETTNAKIDIQRTAIAGVIHDESARNNTIN
jgi:preprotein translocase subunit YajC